MVVTAVATVDAVADAFEALCHDSPAFVAVVTVDAVAKLPLKLAGLLANLLAAKLIHADVAAD